MAADSAKREDLDAAEPRQRPVKSKAVAGDADNEPGPSKRGRMELTRRELAEPKAMNAEATTSTRQTAAAEEVPLLAAQSSATATLEPPMPLAVVTEHLHDENRQPQNMAEEPSLREAMAQHHCQELTRYVERKRDAEMRPKRGNTHFGGQARMATMRNAPLLRFRRQSNHWGIMHLHSHSFIWDPSAY